MPSIYPTWPSPLLAGLFSKAVLNYSSKFPSLPIVFSSLQRHHISLSGPCLTEDWHNILFVPFPSLRRNMFLGVKIKKQNKKAKFKPKLDHDWLYDYRLISSLFYFSYSCPANSHFPKQQHESIIYLTSWIHPEPGTRSQRCRLLLHHLKQISLTVVKNSFALVSFWLSPQHLSFFS